MATYNLKRDSKLYVVRNGLKYQLDIYPDLSYSQTFTETTVQVKTLHSQYDMFENAVITKANPANFSFTIPILLEADLNIVMELLKDYDPSSSEATLKTADLYVESNSEIYKLEKSVFESGVFRITKDSPLLLSVSGTARKLAKFTGSIPGTLQSRSASRTFTTITKMNVVIDGVPQSFITAVSLELRNNVQWVDNGTVHNSIGISDASGNSIFPEAFVVSSRQLSGTIQQYVTDENTDINTWKIGAPISISVGNLGSEYTLEFIIPSTVFTNRLDPQDIIIKSYDFRMNSSPSSLNSVIRKRNI